MIHGGSQVEIVIYETSQCHSVEVNPNGQLEHTDQSESCSLVHNKVPRLRSFPRWEIRLIVNIF